MNSAQAQFFLQCADQLVKQSQNPGWQGGNIPASPEYQPKPAPAPGEPGALLNDYIDDQKAVDKLFPNLGTHDQYGQSRTWPTFDSSVEYEEPELRAALDREIRDDRVAEGRNPGWRGGNIPSSVQPQQPVVQQPPPPQQPVQGQQAQQPTNVKTSEAHAAALLLKCASFLVKQAQQPVQGQQANPYADFDAAYPIPPENAEFYSIHPRTGVRTPMTRQEYAPIYNRARATHGYDSRDAFNADVRANMPRNKWKQWLATPKTWRQARNLTTHYGYTVPDANNNSNPRQQITHSNKYLTHINKDLTHSNKDLTHSNKELTQRHHRQQQHAVLSQQELALAIVIA